jgi:hypothetical protein
VRRQLVIASNLVASARSCASTCLAAASVERAYEVNTSDMQAFAPPLPRSERTDTLAARKG